MPAPQPGLKSRARWVVRTQLAAIGLGRKHTPGIHTRATGFLPFTTPARGCVASAWRQARQGGARHWGTGHLLLALIGQDDGIAAQALQRLGINREELRQQTGQIIAEHPQRAGASPPTPHPPPGVIPAVLAEAAAHCDDHIATWHLLLALYRTEDQAAAQVLARLGAGEGDVRAATDAVLAGIAPEK
jgi:ATP-dependent Clp protease ATP-binding subunit ClpA